MSIISCYSSKGGVGKTATAVNLAYAASEAGLKTLLIDLDQQGASSFYFRVRPHKRLQAQSLVRKSGNARDAIRETDYPQLHILPAHTSYRNFDALLDGMKRSKTRLARFVNEVSGDYDVVILDAPPTLSLVAENVFAAADLILVPIVPTTLSLRTYEQLKDFFRAMEIKRKKLIPFISMADKRKSLHKDSIRELQQSEKRLLHTIIPYSAQVEAMGTEREPLLSFAPRHPCSEAFRELWKETYAHAARRR